MAVSFSDVTTAPRRVQQTFSQLLAAHQPGDQNRHLCTCSGLDGVVEFSIDHQVAAVAAAGLAVVGVPQPDIRGDTVYFHGTTTDYRIAGDQTVVDLGDGYRYRPSHALDDAAALVAAALYLAGQQAVSKASATSRQSRG